MHQDPHRIVEDADDVVFLEEVGCGIMRCDPADCVDIDDEQDKVGRIELPGPLKNSARSDHEAAVHHHAAEQQGRAIAGGKREQIHRAAEAEIAHGEKIHHVMRDVVDQHEPVGETTHKIDPQIAAMRGNARLYRRLHEKLAPQESKSHCETCDLSSVQRLSSANE